MDVRDQYTEQAIALLQGQLLNHADPAVRAIAALCEPPPKGTP